MKLLRKFPENFQNSDVPEDSRSQKITWRGPPLAQAARGRAQGGRPQVAWTGGTSPEAPFGLYLPSDAKTRDIHPYFPEAIPISAAIET